MNLWDSFITNWHTFLREPAGWTPDDVRKWAEDNPGDRNLALAYAVAYHVGDYWSDESTIRPDEESRKQYKAWRNLYDELEQQILDVMKERVATTDDNPHEPVSVFMRCNDFIYPPSWMPEEMVTLGDSIRDEYEKREREKAEIKMQAYRSHTVMK